MGKELGAHVSGSDGVRVALDMNALGCNRNRYR